MGMDKLNSIVSRIFFFVAFFLLLIAILERVVLQFGYTILQATYTPGRLMELSAILLIFVVAMLLRQVREELKKGRA